MLFVNDLKLPVLLQHSKKRPTDTIGYLSEGHECTAHSPALHTPELVEFKRTFDADVFASRMFTLIECAIMISRIQGTDRQIKLITDMLKAEIEQNCV